MRILSDDAWAALASDALATPDDVSERQAALGECLEKLVAADRKLLEQKYFSQLSVAEIAAMQSRGDSSIYRALGRIHQQLLRCVNRALAIS
jgi:DNA-directed RNA polymerase specialized sigma24 family protein